SGPLSRAGSPGSATRKATVSFTRLSPVALLPVCLSGLFLVTAGVLRYHLKRRNRKLQIGVVHQVLSPAGPSVYMLIPVLSKRCATSDPGTICGWPSLWF